MTNDELWRRITNLKGQMLPTATGRGSFWVRTVSHDDVRIRVGKDRPRRLQRTQLEAAYALGLKGDALRPTEIAATKIAEFDSAYVVGILKAVGADRV